MKPLLKWPGGKAREIDQIIDLIPEYDRYIEPFFGGGAMFFHLHVNIRFILYIKLPILYFRLMLHIHNINLLTKYI